MTKPRARNVEAVDRSMDARRTERSQVFFFPKRNPPVSVRAASLQEAEVLLEATNRKEV